MPADPGGLAPRRSKPLATAPTPAYAAILTAPVFAPNRINADKGAAVTAGAAQPSGSLSLLGVALSPRSASAVIRGADGVTQVVQRGERVAGWKLVTVKPSSVRLAGPDGAVTLSLAANAESSKP
ncbi:hypothetical protein V7S57_13470 [Caulobacter sp. CCNWLY153]|uniref:hypothetical protein n=1 Tax=unclassified Caulobacter TaxID=2648921 RepID=UPI002FF31B84